MSATSIMVRITVDPAGRVLVWEHERTLPSDRIVTNDGTGDYEQDVSGPWQTRPGTVDYVMEVIVPIPLLAKPAIREVTEIDARIVKMGPMGGAK